MKEILINDLSEIVKEKNSLSTVPKKGKWQVVPYEVGEFKGKALVAHEIGDAGSLTLQLNKKGYYKIFLGLIGLNGQSSIGIKFEKEKSGSIVNSGNGNNPYWAQYEWIQESFFACSKLDNNNLIIYKPKSEYLNYHSALAFVKLIEMSDNEIKKYFSLDNGKVSYYLDIDFYSDENYKKGETFESRINALRGMGKTILNLESFPTECERANPKKVFQYKNGLEMINNGYGKYISDRKNIEKNLINKAHENNFSVFAAIRTEMGNFVFPSDIYPYNSKIVNDNKDLYCKTREGKTIEALSFAYQKTRRLFVDRVKEISNGFDGITLIFNRGIHVGFEKPVVDEVNKKFGVDAKKLPFTDERLNGVLCKYLTETLRMIKKEIPEKKVYALLFFDKDTSKNFGFDVETWLKEDLIDGVYQGLMSYTENLCGCLDKDGLIDLKKYHELNSKNALLERYFWDGNFERLSSNIINGAKGFKTLCDKYNKDFYATLDWESASPENQIKLAKMLKEEGIEKYFSWNGNHKQKLLPLFNAEKFISRNFSVIPYQTKYHRILSLGGFDISFFNANWRG